MYSELTYLQYVQTSVSTGETRAAPKNLFLGARTPDAILGAPKTVKEILDQNTKLGMCSNPRLLLTAIFFYLIFFSSFSIT